MPDARLSALAELLAAAEDDWYYTVDRSDTSEDPAGSSRKIRRANLLAGRLQTITANTTLSISPAGNDTTGDGSSGNPWATIGKALAFLADKWIANTATVTIQLADGTYNHTSPINPRHPCGRSIAIAGQNTYTRAATAIQSVSGSSGDWSYVLQLDSVTNLAVGDWVLVKSATGDLNPTYLLGMHRITAIDIANARTTLAVKNRTPTAASGATSATLTALKTSLAFSGCDGIVVYDQFCLGGLDKLALVGPGSGMFYGLAAVGSWGGSYAISIGGELRAGPSVGVTAFEEGLFAGHTGRLWAPECVVSNCYNTWGGGATANQFAYLNFSLGISTGNSANGVISNFRSMVDFRGGFAIGNGANGVVADASSALYAGNTTSNANAVNGFYANELSYIQAPNNTALANAAAPLSPLPNTLGNTSAWIKV